VSRTAVLAFGLLAVGVNDAAAQHYVCRTVQPGETVALVAQQLTGRPRIRNASSLPWLRVIDTSRSTVVARRDYDLVLPGWQVCVDARVLSGLAPTAELDSTSDGLAVAPDASYDARWLLVLVAPAGAVIIFWVRRARDRRAVILIEMEWFARMFVHEFERPLMRRADDRPIRSRLQFTPRNGRLKVFLEPGDGRSYPNLKDHRKNLEYDVARVMRSVPNAPVIKDQPYASGSWVVLTFHFDERNKGEGAR
jgi:hypothetical protein